MKSLALELYEHYRGGKSVPRLAVEFGIPMERVAERIWAASMFAAELRARLGPAFADVDVLQSSVAGDRLRPNGRQRALA
ncbi:MAG: hypothetical protein KIT09_23195 [Bryobacteraceae bacterium]|nr:hypothetical protein [Bryobacteraceae bacterium]